MDLTERTQSVILSNLKAPHQRRIGVEVEYIFYNNQHFRLPVNPDAQFSATDFLNEMKALQKDDDPGSGYSLEPGGQFEWASSPFKSLFALQDQFLSHHKRIKYLCSKHELIFIDLALEPVYDPYDVDLIDQNKYRLMHNHFTKVGKHGPWMMRNTTSVQVNIDVASKDDAEEMAFIADCLAPFCALLFANSPFMGGHSVGIKNPRYRIWNDTDSLRCGNLMDHGITKSEGLIEKYSKYLLTVPTIFTYTRDRQTVGFKGTLGEWLTSLEEKKDLQDSDIQAALHQIFTHVRFKHVLEVRGADRPPKGYELAPVAFWTGLLTGDNTRQIILEIVRGWSIQERRKLNRSAEILNLNQVGPAGRSILSWMEEICDLALKGLNERSQNFNIQDERIFLEPYLENVYSNGLMATQVQKQFAESGMKLLDYLKDRMTCE